MPVPRLGVLAHLTLMLAFAWQAPAQESVNAVCASCHEDAVKAVSSTAHGNVSCLTCHPKHEEYPHPEGIPKPECSSCHELQSTAFDLSVHAEAAKAGNAAAPDCVMCHNGAHEVQPPSSAEFRKSSVETCGMCHDEVAQQYNQSIHGQLVARGSMRSAVCSDCHGEHAIQKPATPSSTVNVRNIPETCGQCHAQVSLNAQFRMPLDRVQSFEDSFHGLALKSGVLGVANCASCHGIHNILPSTDPESTIHPANIGNTCGVCHPGAQSRYITTPVHIVTGRNEPLAVQLARQFYWVMIPVTIGFMFLHNVGDWIRKLFKMRFTRKMYTEEGIIVDEVRMHGPERVQHFLLLVSFSVLTWTGFALVYPDQWWARPLLLWEAQYPVRGTIHRVAGIIFMITAGMHLFALIKSERLRRHWYSLFPKKRDIREAIQMFGYNLGLRKQRPVISSHSYIEKAEYWAVVWGAVIMILTGLILWFATWMMTWAPKWVLDLATAVHFYEAVLAALAILVWHIYYVVVDPDVYPMDPAWLTGKSARIRRVRHSDEVDQ